MSDSGISGLNGISHTGAVADQLLSAPSRITPAELKAMIFSSHNRQLKNIRVNFFGVDIEIRQPSLERIIAQVTNADPDMNQGIYILLNYAYVPGTNELLFDISDTESLMSMPYGEDFNRVIEAYQKITGINVADAEKNSKASLSDSK